MSKEFEREQNKFDRWNRPTEDRHCLKCRRPFKSWGKQNRICEDCKKTDSFTSSAITGEYRVIDK